MCAHQHQHVIYLARGCESRVQSDCYTIEWSRGSCEGCGASRAAVFERVTIGFNCLALKGIQAAVRKHNCLAGTKSFPTPPAPFKSTAKFFIALTSPLLQETTCRQIAIGKNVCRSETVQQQNHWTNIGPCI